MHGIFGSRAALQRLGAHDAATFIPDDSIRGESGKSPSLGVGFSLWDEERVHAYSTSLTKGRDTPLAVLRIPKINLEVPVLDGTTV